MPVDPVLGTIRVLQLITAVVLALVVIAAGVLLLQWDSAPFLKWVAFGVVAIVGVDLIDSIIDRLRE